MVRRRYPFWFEEPFERLKRIQEDFYRTMRELWPELSRTKFIPISIGETEKEIILRAELPGFSKDEISLRVTPTTVYISAERKKEAVERDKEIFKMERVYDSASRVLTLPEEVKPETAKAKFKDGILEIRIEKKEVSEKGKEVKIE
jgi:HSP20 family protein